MTSVLLGIALFCQEPGLSVTSESGISAPPQEQIDAFRKKIEASPELKASLLEKFDADKSGDLSDTELSDLLAKGRPGAGKKPAVRKGNREGKPGFKVAREKIVEKFDTDGDSQLNEAEKEAMKAKMLQEENKMFRARMASDPKFKARMLEKLDADKSGDLSDEEINAHLRERLQNRTEEMKKNHQEAISKFDLDGDGVLNEAERSAMKEAKKTEIMENNPELKRKMLERFDTDKDGTLNEAEKAAMKEKHSNRKNGKGKGWKNR